MARVDTDELRRRLKRLPTAVRRAAATAHEASAAEFVSTARQFAPVAGVDGGELRDSIRHEPTDTGGQIVRAGGATTTRHTARGPFDYSRAVEFGDSPTKPAQPFFWPAYRLLRKRFTSRRKRAVTKAFKETFNG